MTTTQQPQAIHSIRPSQPSSTSPPVNISSRCHLDPACYVKGTHPLTIQADVVVHPRCRLYTDQGPITIQQGCILNEKCILGTDKELNPIVKGVAPSNSSTIASQQPGFLSSDNSTISPEINIGPRAYLQSTVRLQPPCNIGDSVLLEAGVTLLSGCSVGAHSKICAGVTLPPDTVIPAWTVAYGHHGQMRRKRQANVAEDSRLDGMGRERDGVESLLKTNTAKNLSAVGSGSRDKRASIIKSAGQKG